MDAEKSKSDLDGVGGKYWPTKPTSYNPELSKRLLAEAGYADGLMLRGINYNSESAVTLGTAVKNMLVRVGIN